MNLAFRIIFVYILLTTLRDSYEHDFHSSNLSNNSKYFKFKNSTPISSDNFAVFLEFDLKNTHKKRHKKIGNIALVCHFWFRQFKTSLLVFFLNTMH